MPAEDATARLLTPADIDEALRLTRAAGWNQLPSDWLRLMTLDPHGCLGLVSGGILASSTTVLCYGRELAWIGMVLTAPEFRRRGFAERLMERAVEYLERRDIATAKLDATDFGVKLYRKFGFEEECLVERWQRSPAPLAPVEKLSPFDETDFAYDRGKFGADRSTLLASLRPLGAARVPNEGYAMGRPGFVAAYFGPCVASSAAAAEKLARWFVASHAEENSFWDLFPGNADAVHIARDLGFTPVRRLTRMVRARASAPQIVNHPEIYAIAGFELG